jgi:hypothetical protein
VSAWFFKKGKALHPADEDAEKGVAKMGDGECVLVTIERARCPILFRKYHAMCQRIAENTGRDKDGIDYEIRILAGHYNVLPGDGFEIRTPKRIAFAKLSQEQWEDYFQRAEQAIAEKWGPEYLERAA